MKNMRPREEYKSEKDPCSRMECQIINTFNLSCDVHALKVKVLNLYCFDEQIEVRADLKFMSGTSRPQVYYPARLSQGITRQYRRVMFIVKKGTSSRNTLPEEIQYKPQMNEH